MTLAEIRRRIQAGQKFTVTNHQRPDLDPITVQVNRTSEYAFHVDHPLGQKRISWPPARHVTVDPSGALHLHGTATDAGLPYLTLVPQTPHLFSDTEAPAKDGNDA